MREKIIVFKQENRSKSVQLSRALHGYKDRSNYGKYTYKRKGLLDEIPNLEIFRGVLLLREEDIDRLIELLQKYQAEYYIGTLEMSSKDIETPLIDEQ